MDLQYWFTINLERVNWEIYLFYSSLKSLKFWGIRNESLEVVETSLNSSPSFLKKLPNKVIELLSLPLLYSPSFFKLPNRPLGSKKGGERERERERVELDNAISDHVEPKFCGLVSCHRSCHSWSCFE